MDFKKDDRVIYGCEGICTVSGFEERKVADKTVTYYILKPLDRANSVFYVPTQSDAAKSKMRKIISAEEIEALIESAPFYTLSESDRQRKDEYRSALNFADREKVFSMVKSVYRMEKELLLEGKRLYRVDEYFLDDVVKLMYGELILFYELEKEDVVPFISGEIKLKRK